mgnify:CR=1 FL=1
MKEIVSRLYQHTDIEDIKDTIIQYAENCQQSEGPPVRDLPDCISYAKEKSRKWQSYMPTPEEMDALTKLWRTYVKFVVTTLKKRNLNSEDKKDILMHSFELIQLDVSKYNPKRGKLTNYIYYNFRRSVNNAASNYINKDIYSEVPLDDLDIVYTHNNSSPTLETFAEEVGVTHELDILTNQIEKLL